MLSRLPHFPSQRPSPEPVKLEWSVPATDTTIDWSVFRGTVAGASLGQPDFARDFRFAGTFFLSGGGNREIRKAVLGVESLDKQVIASEGDEIAGVSVARIFQDRVILRRGEETAELRLSFAPDGLSSDSEDGPEDSKVSESSQFGDRIGTDNWVLKRSSLLEYYEELLNEPERLLQVFDSLKPLYNDEGSIEGYRLGVEGEREFFDSVGFREGDVVRKVNSLQMTSRNRAEFFIRQVVDSKLNAVVIDIERGGAARRLVYQIR